MEICEICPDTKLCIYNIYFNISLPELKGEVDAKINFLCLNFVMKTMTKYILQQPFFYMTKTR